MTRKRHRGAGYARRRGGSIWAPVLIGPLIIVGTGCVVDDGPGSGSSPSETGTSPSVTSRGERPDNTSRSESTEPPPNANSADAFVRVTFDGLTFAYPPTVFSDAVRSDAAGSPGVAATLRGPRGEATLTVTVVRSADGAFVEPHSPQDRALLEQLESQALVGESLGFVNGGGVRTAVDDDYSFVGTTVDGRYLVRVAAALPASADVGDVGELDAWVSTIFVDATSESLSDTCVPAVEVVSEVDVDADPVVRPGQVVTASWETRNAGTCAWADGDGWVFSGGDPVTLLESDDAGGVAPGDVHRVEVTFRAPDEPGRYTAQWQFRAGGRLEPLGPIQAISIEVDAN